VAGKSVDGIVSTGNKVDTGSKILKNAKDAKKLDGNSEANKFAKEKGYKDAHELKKDYIGKDNISKYDIYRNNKTGEYFLINKTGTSIVPVD
jgi:filamentous hemagglutinin